MNLSEFTTLAEAQAHEVISGQMIHRDSMNGWLGQAGVYKAMKAVAADELNPFSDVMEAFLDSEELYCSDCQLEAESEAMG